MTKRPFVIVGSTPEHLWRTLVLLGPRREGQGYGAYTDWEIAWRLLPVRFPSGVAPSNVRVDVTATMHLPSWSPPRSASASFILRFREYLALLEAHEWGHIAIAREAGAAVAAELLALGRGADVAGLEGEAESAVRAIVAEHRRREKAYDVETEHGARSGARFPW